jgi:hypothetical protein
MNVKLLSMARRLWNAGHAPTEVNRNNQLKWARAVHRLGDKWLLATYVQKKAGLH